MFTIACDRRRGGVRWSLVCASAATAMLVALAGNAQGIDNEFGTQTLDIIEPTSLCLASQRTFLVP